jgi:HD-like signal output (HDOD) protein
MTSALPAPVVELFQHRLRAGDIELPLLDTTTTRIIELASNPDADVDEVAQAIGTDQAMVAHLLRVTNSSLYSPVSPIVSIQQAIIRLGLKKIQEIALVISCQNAIFDAPGFEQILKDEFHSALITALVAQQINKTRRHSAEEGFLCGLLRGVGFPVLIQIMVHCHRDTDTEVDVDDVMTFAERVHPVVGGDLITNWGLPSRIASAVRHQRSPDEAGAENRLAWLCQLSGACCELMEQDETKPEALDDLLEHPALSELDLFDDELSDTVLDRSEEIIAQAGAIL